ncbi:MAG TPA: DUF6694 family lipoprotein, partial [Rubricoccaceae bacterium]
MHLLYTLVLAVVLTGCSTPSIDAESCRPSIAAVNESVPDDEQDAFQRSLMRLVASKTSPSAMVTAGTDSTAFIALVCDHLDGMTAEEITEAAQNAPEPDMGALDGAEAGAAMTNGPNAPGSAV